MDTVKEYVLAQKASLLERATQLDVKANEHIDSPNQGYYDHGFNAGCANQSLLALNILRQVEQLLDAEEESKKLKQKSFIVQALMSVYYKIKKKLTLHESI